MSEARYLRKQSNKQGSEHLIQVILYLRGMLRLYLHILLLAFSARKTMVFFPLTNSNYVQLHRQNLISLPRCPRKCV